MFKGGFIQNLPKIYGLYTGGFIVFVSFFSFLFEQELTKISVTEKIKSFLNIFIYNFEL